MRRLYRSCAEQHLAARPHGDVRSALAIDQPHGAAVFNQHTLRQCAGFNLKVGAAHCGPQIVVARVSPPAAFRVVLQIAHALKARPVVILDRRHARLLRARNEALRQRITVTIAGDVHRPVMPAILRITLRKTLHAFEVRQNVAAAPARIAESRPVVEF